MPTPLALGNRKDRRLVLEEVFRSSSFFLCIFSEEDVYF